MTDRTKHDADIRHQLRLLQLADRVGRHLCLECGTAGHVVKGLCIACRKLPRYQELLALELPSQEEEPGE